MSSNAWVAEIRKQFPILSGKIHGKPLVYFDNAATSQKPLSVINAIGDFYRNDNSNVHRGVHTLSQRSTDLYEAARERVRKFINAESSDEIIFTRGTTESLNLAANSLIQNLEEGDEILCTEMEHHSNFVPWQVIAQKRNIVFKTVPVSDSGELSLAAVETLITGRTKIVALAHASNTLGTINDVAAICRIAKKKGAITVIDGAQFIPHGEVDVRALGCDLYAFSGHKMMGPTGIGVLYGRSKVLSEMPPWQYGGGMIGEVSTERTTFTARPFVFEAGTPNISGAFALGKAMDYIAETGYKEMEAQEKSLLKYATEKLHEIPGIKIYGTSPEKVPLISFLVGNIHPFDLGTMLDQMGIAVRTGHHCTQPLMSRFGIPGTVRASFSFYNTLEEVDSFKEAMVKSIKILS